jgi:hypothetical protein
VVSVSAAKTVRLPIPTLLDMWRSTTGTVAVGFNEEARCMVQTHRNNLEFLWTAIPPGTSLSSERLRIKPRCTSGLEAHGHRRERLLQEWVASVAPSL